jgi:hypothetical protein
MGFGYPPARVVSRGWGLGSETPMGYVIAAILVVLIVGAVVTFMVMQSAKRSNVSDADDPGREGSAGMLGSDSGSPVGDTREHAGEQSSEGATVGAQDADRHGGTGGPQGGYAGSGETGSDPEPDDPRVARPVVGGEAEGERRTTD